MAEPSPTGLGLLERTVLQAVDAVAAGRPGYQRTTAVLDHLERADGVGPTYAVRVLQDLGVPWRVHLRLLDLDGNWGTAGHDPMADPRYTRLRLSALGRLALASVRGEVGPVPVGVVEGSLYRGGEVPPFAPAAVVAALQALVADPTLPVRRLRALLGEPTMPSGGTVEGALGGLWAGRRTEVALACSTRHDAAGCGRHSGRPAVVVTGLPLGVNPDELVGNLEQRSVQHAGRGFGPDGFTGELRSARLVDVADESSARVGTRIAVVPLDGRSLDETEQWMRTVWPFVTRTHLRLPAPVGGWMHGWADACRADPSGLDALAALL